MVDLVTSVSLWELIKHAGSWIVNLKRASAARKEESVNALRQVILAAQKSAWLFWGNIYRFNRKLNVVKYFHQWFDLNHDKFHKVSFHKVQLVRVGTVITAKEGYIYCSIPKNVNADMIKQARISATSATPRYYATKRIAS